MTWQIRGRRGAGNADRALERVPGAAVETPNAAVVND